MKRENNSSYNTLTLPQCKRMWSINSSMCIIKETSISQRPPPPLQLIKSQSFPPSCLRCKKAHLRWNPRIPHNTSWELHYISCLYASIKWFNRESPTLRFNPTHLILFTLKYHFILKSCQKALHKKNLTII